MFVFNDFSDALRQFFIEQECVYEIELDKIQNEYILFDQSLLNPVNLQKKDSQQNFFPINLQKFFRKNKVFVYYDSNFSQLSKNDYTQIKNLKLKLFSIELKKEYSSILRVKDNSLYNRKMLQFIQMFDSYVNFYSSLIYQHQIIFQLEKIGVKTLRSPSFSIYQIIQDKTIFKNAVIAGSSNLIFLNQNKNFIIQIKDNKAIFLDMMKLRNKFALKKKYISSIFFWIFMLYSSKKEFNLQQRFLKILNQNPNDILFAYRQDLKEAGEFIMEQMQLLMKLENLQIDIHETNNLEKFFKLYTPKIQKYFKIFTQCLVYCQKKNTLKNLRIFRKAAEQFKRNIDINNFKNINYFYYNLVPQDYLNIFDVKKNQIVFKTQIFKVYSHELLILENTKFYEYDRKICKNIQGTFYLKYPSKFLVKNIFKKQFHKLQNKNLNGQFIYQEVFQKRLLNIDEILIEHFDNKENKQNQFAINQYFLINYSCLNFLEQINLIDTKDRSQRFTSNIFIRMSKHGLLEETLIFQKLVEQECFNFDNFLNYSPIKYQLYNNFVDKKYTNKIYNNFQLKTDLFSPSYFEVIKDALKKKINKKQLIDVLWYVTKSNLFQCTQNNQEIYQRLMIETGLQYFKKIKFNIQDWEVLFKEFWENYEKISFLSTTILILKQCQYEKISFNDLRAIKIASLIDSIKSKYRNMIISNYFNFLSQFQINGNLKIKKIIEHCPFSSYSSPLITIRLKEMMFFYCILINEEVQTEQFNLFVKKRILKNFTNADFRNLKRLHNFFYFFEKENSKDFFNTKFQNLSKQIKNSLPFLCQVIIFLQTQKLKIFNQNLIKINTNEFH